MSGIPIQSGCNMDDPKEHAAWALVGLAGPQSHAPLIVPPAVIAAWSEHLYDAGFRHHPEHQAIKYVPPAPGSNWVQGAAGRWVPIDEELPPEVTAPDVSHLSDDEKRIIRDRINADLDGATFPDNSDHAQVSYD